MSIQLFIIKLCSTIYMSKQCCSFQMLISSLFKLNDYFGKQTNRQDIFSHKNVAKGFYRYKNVYLAKHKCMSVDDKMIHSYHGECWPPVTLGQCVEAFPAWDENLFILSTEDSRSRLLHWVHCHFKGAFIDSSIPSFMTKILRYSQGFKAWLEHFVQVWS